MNSQNLRDKIFSALVIFCLTSLFIFPIAQASAFSGGCVALVQWVGQFENEFPGMNLKHVNGDPRFMLKFANLFRDKFFIPVFGEAYDPGPSDSKDALFKSVMKECSGLEKYIKILEGAFGKGYNRYLWSKQISDAIKTHKDQESWISETSAAIQKSQANLSDFENLREYSRQGRAINFALWPSEKAGFDSLKGDLEKRMNQVVQKLGTKTLNEVANMKATLANAHTLKFEIIPRNAEFGNALESSNDTGKWEEAYNKKLDSIITALVEERTTVLNGISNSVPGLQESIAWKTRFQEDFSKFNEFQQVKNAVESVFPKKRGTIFQTIKPDFQKALSALNPELASLSKGDDLLQTLFSLSEDNSLSIYKDYQNILEGYKEGMLSKLIAVRLESLNRIPQTLSGAQKVLEWKEILEKDFSAYMTYKPVKSAQNKWRDKRMAILRKAKDEFVEKQKSLPADKSGLRRSVDMLDDIFPTLEDERLPIYQDYRKAVLSQIKVIREKMG